MPARVARDDGPPPFRLRYPSADVDGETLEATDFEVPGIRWTYVFKFARQGRVLNGAGSATGAAVILRITVQARHTVRAG